MNVYLDLIPEQFLKDVIVNQKDGVPKGIRTPVTAVKGQCPRPLDDGDLGTFYYLQHYIDFTNNGVPKGIRTPVTAVKGQCPRPLDDGDLELFFHQHPTMSTGTT